jgi:hypothetical protein
MMWQAVESQSHDFGSATTYFYGQGNVVILDSYADQYSLNWSTALNPSNFARLWAHSGYKNQGAIIHSAGRAELRELVPGEVFGVFSPLDNILRQPVSLFRLFFTSVSVTWQLLPQVDGPFPAVVGIASDRLDLYAISRYYQVTARPALREAVADLPAILQKVKLRRGGLGPLINAAQGAEDWSV